MVHALSQPGSDDQGTGIMVHSGSKFLDVPGHWRARGSVQRQDKPRQVTYKYNDDPDLG